MGKIKDREAVLLEALRSKNNMDIKEVIDLLRISESTARRLFTNLQNDNKIIRTHGGIQLLQNKIIDYSFDDLEFSQSEEKNKIGMAAASLINDNDIIFLDAGTTVLRLCYYLAERIKQEKVKDIIAFTNSIAVLQVMHPFCKVILFGGEYRHKRRDFSGFINEKTVLNFRFNNCFLGADGVDLNEGFMATDIDTAHIDELIISRSEKITILLDSDKFSKCSLITFTSFKDIDYIVTDNNIPESIRLNIESKGAKLITDINN